MRPSDPGSQIGFLIVRSCVRPRAVHLARAGFSASLRTLSRRFDDRIREALRRLVRAPVAIGTEAGDQCSLPL